MSGSPLRLSFVDRVIARVDDAVRERFGGSSGPASAPMPYPADAAAADLSGRASESALASPPMGSREPTDADEQLTARERRRVGALMRVNHAGEVAAQALYEGQGLLARDPKVRKTLADAAKEEAAHLNWCRRRLDELDDRPSRLDPLWYAGSFAIGVAVAARGDAASLGFVAETERQVVEHLNKHLARLPEGDHRSRAVLQQMIEDESRHGTTALSEGGRLPGRRARFAMRLMSKVMTKTAYRW